MFDRELLVNSTIDLDAGAIWSAAVNTAADIMMKARDRYALCRINHGQPEYHPWCAYRADACQLRAHCATLMHPFRTAIAERTDQERLQAWSMVRTGNARFLQDDIDQGDTHECGRPYWQHIILDESRTLCPFGREYWTYARAICQYNPGVIYDHMHIRIRTIATPKRNG